MKKKLLAGMLSVTMMASLIACGTDKKISKNTTTGKKVAEVIFDGNGDSNNKTLIAYFSYFDNTESEKITTKKYADAISSASVTIVDGNRIGNNDIVADILKDQTGADVFSILTAEQYSPDYDGGFVEQAQVDLKNQVKPALASHISNLDQYDTVIVLFPTWWYDMPMALYSFFDEYDFSGKTIAPVATSGGSGLVDTVDSIKKLEPNATVTEGLEIYQTDVVDSGSTISDWLKKIGVKTIN